MNKNPDTRKPCEFASSSNLDLQGIMFHNNIAIIAYLKACCMADSVLLTSACIVIFTTWYFEV